MSDGEVLVEDSLANFDKTCKPFRLLFNIRQSMDTSPGVCGTTLAANASKGTLEPDSEKVNRTLKCSQLKAQCSEDFDILLY